MNDLASSWKKAQIGEGEPEDAKFVAESALPIFLFDHGYDVWFNANRGTLSNRKHVSDEAGAPYSGEDAYWQFDYS